MKRTAFGLIRPDGRDPALRASTCAPPCMRAKASAIWLRLEFSMQTKRTRFMRRDSAAAGRGRATRGARVDLRLHAGDIRAARSAIGGASRATRVVFGRFAEGVERLPTRALRILGPQLRSEEHTSELQSLMRISYAVFCLKKKK